MGHLDFATLINERIGTCQLEGLEVPMAELCLTDLFVLRQQVCCLLTGDLVSQKLDGNVIFNDHSPSVHCWICKLVELVSPLIDRSSIGRLNQVSKDLCWGH